MKEFNLNIKKRDVSYRKIETYTYDELSQMTYEEIQNQFYQEVPQKSITLTLSQPLKEVTI